MNTERPAYKPFEARLIQHLKERFEKSALEVDDHLKVGNLPLEIDMELNYQLGTATVCVTRGSYLQTGTPNQISVRWRTSLATDSRVQYGTDAGNLTLVADDPAVTTEHEVKLTNLAANTNERSFWLDCHYGTSGTLTSNMILDGGSGRTDSDGAYTKPTFAPASHEGAVYVVAPGSRRKLFDQPGGDQQGISAYMP